MGTHSDLWKSQSYKGSSVQERTSYWDVMFKDSQETVLLKHHPANYLPMMVLSFFVCLYQNAGVVLTGQIRPTARPLCWNTAQWLWPYMTVRWSARSALLITHTPVRCSWHRPLESVTSKQISDNGKHLYASVKSWASIMYAYTQRMQLKTVWNIFWAKRERQ